MRKNYFRQLLVAVVALLCCTMANAHDFVVNDIYYKIISDTDFTVEVTFEGSSYSSSKKTYTGDVVIPSTVTYKDKEYDIVGVGTRAFNDCKNLTSVTLPDSLTKIDNYAFYGCVALDSIVMPKSLETIGTYAFSGCTDLDSITIPANLTSLGAYSFKGCSSLKAVAIPENITSLPNYVFYYCI